MLSVELHGYFTQHEHTEIARIHAMLDLFATEHCLGYRLAEYFGDDNAPHAMRALFGVSRAGGAIAGAAAIAGACG